MSETTTTSHDTTTTTPAAAAVHENPAEAAARKFLGWFHPAAGTTTRTHPAALPGVLEHASAALPIVSKIIDAARLIDPADAAMLTAFADLLPAALDMAGKAIDDALAVLRA